MIIDVKTSIERNRAMRNQDTELSAFEKMNGTMKRMYIQQLVRSYETHVKTAKYDDQAGYHHSAQTHKDNAMADLNSLRAILSEVRFNDVVGEL